MPVWPLLDGRGHLRRRHQGPRDLAQTLIGVLFLCERLAEKRNDARKMELLGEVARRGVARDLVSSAQVVCDSARSLVAVTAASTRKHFSGVGNRFAAVRQRNSNRSDFRFHRNRTRSGAAAFGNVRTCGTHHRPRMSPAAFKAEVITSLMSMRENDGVFLSPRSS